MNVSETHWNDSQSTKNPPDGVAPIVSRRFVRYSIVYGPVLFSNIGNGTKLIGIFKRNKQNSSNNAATVGRWETICVIHVNLWNI